MPMTRLIAIMGTVAILAGCQTAAPSAPSDLATARSQFARFAALDGEWRATGGNHAQGATHSYRTIANGSVVVETAFPGLPHEMVTVIHVDGSDLVLTHYCAAGNQPHMVAAPSDDKTVDFRFVKAGNLVDPNADHMRDATFTFIDADHLRTRWSFWSGGEKTSEMVVVLERLSK